MEAIQLDTVTEALQKQYFQMLKLEDFPRTPDLTKKIDELEVEISKRRGITKEGK